MGGDFESPFEESVADAIRTLGYQPIPHIRVEIVRPGAQPLQMQRRALRRGDDIRRATRPFGLRNRHRLGGFQRRRYRIDRRKRFGRRPGAKIPPSRGNPQPANATVQHAGHRIGGPVHTHRIGRIVPLHRIIRRSQVPDGSRQRSKMIQAGYEREAARPSQPPIGRFQPEYPAERRRHPDRPIGVRPQRQRHQASTNRAARTARGPARHARRVVRIARRPVMRVLAGEVIGVFAHVQRPHQDRAGGFQPRDQRSIRHRRPMVAVDLRSRQGRQSCHVDQVLHRERHPRQRPNRLARRSHESTFGKHGREGVQHRVQPPDAVQARRHHRRRRGAPRRDGSRDRGRRAVHARNTGAGSNSSGKSASRTVSACPSEIARCIRTACRQAGFIVIPIIAEPASIKPSKAASSIVSPRIAFAARRASRRAR